MALSSAMVLPEATQLFSEVFGAEIRQLRLGVCTHIVGATNEKASHGPGD
jgi:hypothetical protein